MKKVDCQECLDTGYLTIREPGNNKLWIDLTKACKLCSILVDKSDIDNQADQKLSREKAMERIRQIKQQILKL